MKSFKKAHYLFASVLFITIALLQGCSEQVASKSSSGSNNQPTPTLAPTPTPTPTADYLSVTVGNSTEIQSYMHVNSSFGTQCQISSDATSSEDIVCIVEVPEGDIYYHGLELKYNVPQGMCTYLRRSPYWFYNHESGYGPDSLVIDISADTTGVVSAYTCAVDGGAAGACTGQKEITVNQTNNTPTCVYDKTTTGGKNCCFGKYTFTVNKTNTDTSVTTTETVEKSWGGDYKSCIGGSAVTDWTGFESTSVDKNIPVDLIDDAEDGILATYKVTAPIKSTNNRKNYDVANFYTPALHTHDGYVAGTVSNMPYFVDPIDDRSGSVMYSGSDSYAFVCLDQAYEVLHRIRVYVREWDTEEDYLTYKSSGGVTVVPDRANDVTCPTPDNVCNNIYDLDNFRSLVVGGAYETATISLRYRNFPKLTH